MKPFSLKRLLQKLSGLGRETLDVLTRPKTTPPQQMANMCRAILNLKGEAAAVAIAEELHNLYDQCSMEEKRDFMLMLYEEFPVPKDGVDEAIAKYQQSGSQQDIIALNHATESPRQELFRMLNMAPEATAALIGFREDLLSMLPENPELDVINQDLLHLFRSWFNRGFLELRRIDWQTPALILEKLIEYESVHEIKGWDDLRRRLQDDRRCFGFFHPVIPHIPLIFVEVALTREMSGSISALLQPLSDEEATEPTAAIFYSINNCLTGLRGVSFGNLLIKQVVASLAAEFPDISIYSTLSPIPGLTRWMSKAVELPELVNEQEKDLLLQTLEKAKQGKAFENTETLRALCIRLCAHYLLKEKSRGKPADAVARFHLGNGARLERINWNADHSWNGLKQSLGMMVNYLYDTTEMAENHAAYELRDEVVCSQETRRLIPNGSQK